MKLLLKTVLFLGICILGCRSAQGQNTKDMENKNVLGLRTTIYKVPDLQKAKVWYSKAFETQPYFDEVFYTGFNVGGYELGLLPEETSSAEKSDNVLSYWGVVDIQKRYDYLLSLGATEHEKPTNVGGPIITASVRDPWGNVVGLIFNPTFQITGGNE